jgi:hypothetical protein
MKRAVHVLDYLQIDELDEDDGEEQMVLIWCRTHKTWEWHWVAKELLGLA